MAVKARWKGKDFGDDKFGHINGIPARSLDEDEYDALTKEQKEEVQKSPLYDVRSERDAPAHRPATVHRDEPAAVTAEAEPKGGG